MRVGCYPPRLKAEVNNILRDLHNSSHHTKVEFNNCLLFIQNISKFLTSLPPRRLTFSRYKKILNLADTLQKVDKIHRAMYLRILSFLPFSPRQEFSYFVFEKP